MTKTQLRLFVGFSVLNAGLFGLKPEPAKASFGGCSSSSSTGKCNCIAAGEIFFCGASQYQGCEDDEECE